MQTTLSTVNWRRVLTVLGAVVLAIVAIWFAARIPRTMTIFVIGAFVASAARPIVRALEAHKISRGLAIAIIYVLLILGAVVSALIVLPLTFVQLQVIVANIPSYLQTTQDWATHLESVIRSHFPYANLPPQLLDIRQLGSERINAIFSATLTSLGALAFNLATAMFVVISALILSFFFLLNDRQLAEGFASLFPARHRETAQALATEIVQVFGGFIAGQVIVSAITGAAIAALTALFGFKFALLLGLVSALAYAVPIVGMLVAHALGLVVAAPQGIVMVLIVQTVLFVVARISDNVLVPKIMGGSVGVSPIAVMFAVFAGGELFGLPGLILGIPAAALIKLLWRYFAVPWLHGQIEIADTSSPLPEAAEAAPGPPAPQQAANTPQIQLP